MILVNDRKPRWSARMQVRRTQSRLPHSWCLPIMKPDFESGRALSGVAVVMRFPRRRARNRAAAQLGWLGHVTQRNHRTFGRAGVGCVARLVAHATNRSRGQLA